MLAFFDWESSKLRWRRAPKAPRAEGERPQPPAATTPAAPAASGVTPVAQVTTIESLKDVVPVEKSGLPGTLGYVYYEYEYLEPVQNAPQVLLRVIRLDPTGTHGTELQAEGDMNDPATFATNASKIVTFWNDLPLFLLDKIYRRDGISFLPDAFDNVWLIPPRELLTTLCIMQLRTIRTVIDNYSWNEGTRGELRTAFARKNRRCLEAENNLATIETSPLWSTILGMSEPVVSPRAGGPILLTLPDFYNIVTCFVTLDEAHPAFINKALVSDKYTLISTSSAVDQLLGEVENAIRILRHRDQTEFVALDGNTGTSGASWIAGSGRGVQADLKYVTKMLHELKYPSIGSIITGDVLTDLGRWNQKLYGEALYGVDLEDATPDVRHYVGYPEIRTGDKAVYRRGFEPFNPLNEAGLDEIWAVESDTSDETLLLLGMKAQVGVSDGNAVASKFGTIIVKRDGSRVTPPSEYNFDDGTQMRAWLENSLASDHQWNEGIFLRLDSNSVVKPDQPAVYGIHQSVLVPFEGFRKYLCEAYNVPFQR